MSDWHYTFHRNKAFDTDKKNYDKFMTDNIYSFEGTIGDFVKKENRLHNWFKYRFLSPFVFIAEKIISKKYLVKKVPNKRQYRNLKIFEKSFKESVRQWNELFLSRVGTGDKREGFSLKGYLRMRCNRMLLTMMRVYVTFTMNDTAYLEMHNILMFNITKNMSKEYGERYNHLFYTSKNVNDIAYFTAIQHIDEVVVIKPINQPEGTTYAYTTEYNPED